MQRSIIWILFLALVSCNNPDQQAAGTVSNLPIQMFLSKFKTIQLPFYFTGWDNANINKEQLWTMNFRSNDSLFLKPENGETIYGYGLLSDTSQFYAVVYFAQGEDIYPIVATYTKHGQLINKQTLLARGCGSDCGQVYCSYSARINSTYQLYVADTIKYQGICDTSGNYLPNSDTTYIVERKGQINTNGLIILGPETQSNHKGIQQ
jgi:hypothetical protein